MNIGVIQIYTADIKEYAEYGRLINAQYAISHGYEYVCWEYSLVPLERSVYYNKILAMLAAFDSDL
jgi:hypothetical protein